MSDVVELSPDDPRATVCGTCGRGWDDSVSTSVTPTPSGRCPFEYEHLAEYWVTIPPIVVHAENADHAVEQFYDIIRDFGYELVLSDEREAGIIWDTITREGI